MTSTPSNESLKQPLQKRSKATLQRILDATKKLLEQKRFEDISMQEIAAAADCGVGTVYGRFENKTALLTALELEILDDILRRRDLFLKKRDWSQVSFATRAKELIEHIFAGYQRHGFVLREFVSRVHIRSKGASEPTKTEMSNVFNEDVLFLIGTTQPATSKLKKVVALALISAITTIQNRLLQQVTSPIDAKFSDSFLKEQLAKMVIAYVQAEFPEVK